MPISYTYNTIFIHIPKCAGTTVEKILGTFTQEEFFSFKKDMFENQKTTPQHFTYLQLKNYLPIDWTNFYTFSVVRNPYSRFVSEYKYRKNLFLKNNVSTPNIGSFHDFTLNLNIEEDKRIFDFDGHLETQTKFLKNESNLIEPSIQIFNFENLAPCWVMLEEKTGVKYQNYLWSRKNNDSTPYQDYYTPEIKDIVYNFYKEDFDNFGYSADL